MTTGSSDSYEHEGLVFTSSGQELNTGTSSSTLRRSRSAASSTRTATYLERSTPMTVSLKDGESTSTCWSESYVYQTSTVTDEFGEYCFLGLNPYKTYAVYEDLDDDSIKDLRARGTCVHVLWTGAQHRN